MRVLAHAIVCVLAAYGCATGEAIDDPVGSGAFGGTSTDGGDFGGSAGAGTGGSSSGGDGGSTTGGAAGAAAGGTGGSGTGGSGVGGSGTGGSGTGGSGTGGSGVGGSGTGGVGGSGVGGSGTGGSGTGGSGGGCQPGQKLCGGVCIGPAPGIGCSLTNCTPCPAPPPNSDGACSGDQCDFTCHSGYTKTGGTCVPVGGTGGSGSGGVGGSGSGGVGGGTGCPQPCDFSQGESQLICTALCVIQGKFGLCLPTNCCGCF